MNVFAPLIMLILLSLPPCASASEETQGSSIALLPVQFVTSQPEFLCHGDIDEDLQRELSKDLQRAGHRVTTIPLASPRTLALDPPSPEPGHRPAVLALAPRATDLALGIWVEKYIAPGLCDRQGGNSLEMRVTYILYRLPDGEEVDRLTAVAWDSGSLSTEMVRRVIWQLADQLMEGLFPAND